MVLTLYTFPTATTRKVHITLEELGLKYNLKKVEVYQGKHYGEEFLKINRKLITDQLLNRYRIPSTEC